MSTRLLLAACLAIRLTGLHADDSIPAPPPERAAEPRPEKAQPQPVAKPAPENDDRTFLLRYEFVNVGSVHYRVMQKEGMVTRKGDVETTVTRAVETEKHFRVISVDENGTALLESGIDRVRMAVKFDDAEPVRFDSASDAKPTKHFREVAASIGKPLARFKVDANGKLLSLVRLDGKPKPARRRKPTDDEEDGKRDEVDVSANVLVAFPAKPIRIGDTWTEEFTTPVTITRTVTRDAKLQRTYKLESVEDGLATIGYEIAVRDLVRLPAIAMQLVQRTPKGKIVFDIEQGRIVSRTQSLDERVFGPFGPGSLVHAWNNRTEKIVDRDREKAVKTAAKN